MRLFSALLPPAAAGAHLAERLAEHLAGGAHRYEPRSRWHITLCFYGEDDPATRAAELRAGLAGRAAPRLRLAGSGRFGRVYYAAVQDEPDGAVGELAAACGAGSDYRPHLTLTRAGHRLHGDPLDGYTGPWFTPAEAVLLASAGGRYRPLERFALGAG